MGLVEVLDGAAVVARTITGLAGASGATTGTGPMPMEMPTTPYAIAYLNPGSARLGGAAHLFTDEIEFRVYVPKADLPQAYATLLAFPDRFATAWALVANRPLGGTCDDSSYVGHGKVEVETWGGGPGVPGVDLLFIPIRIGVLRTAAAVST